MVLQFSAPAAAGGKAPGQMGCHSLTWRNEHRCSAATSSPQMTSALLKTCHAGVCFSAVSRTPARAAYEGGVLMNPFMNPFVKKISKWMGVSSLALFLLVIALRAAAQAQNPTSIPNGLPSWAYNIPDKDQPPVP